MEEVFSEAKRSAFWVVEMDARIIGMFGIEGYDEERAKLRRMYSTGATVDEVLRSVCYAAPRPALVNSAFPSWS
jgi:hypothetical protein